MTQIWQRNHYVVHMLDKNKNVCFWLHHGRCWTEFYQLKNCCKNLVMCCGAQKRKSNLIYMKEKCSCLLLLELLIKRESKQLFQKSLQISVVYCRLSMNVNTANRCSITLCIRVFKQRTEHRVLLPLDQMWLHFFPSLPSTYPHAIIFFMVNKNCHTQIMSVKTRRHNIKVALMLMTSFVIRRSRSPLFAQKLNFDKQIK